MSLRYFLKGILSQNPVMDRYGRGIPWETLQGNQGVLVLDEASNAELIADMDAIAGTRGVISISEERYQEVKKKSLSRPFMRRDPSSVGLIRVHQTDLSPRKKPVAPSVALVEKVEAPKPPVNTPLPGGDSKLAAASVPPGRPQHTLARARPVRFEGQTVVHHVPIEAPEPVVIKHVEPPPAAVEPAPVATLMAVPEPASVPVVSETDVQLPVKSKGGRPRKLPVPPRVNPSYQFA